MAVSEKVMDKWNSMSKKLKIFYRRLKLMASTIEDNHILVPLHDHVPVIVREQNLHRAQLPRSTFCSFRLVRSNCVDLKEQRS